MAIRSPLRQCQVCAEKPAKYTCPRCNVVYCSVGCYREHSSECTEAFFREHVVAERRLLDDGASKRRLESVLRRERGGEAEDEEDEKELGEGIGGLSSKSIEALLKALPEVDRGNVASGGVEAMMEALDRLPEEELARHLHASDVRKAVRSYRQMPPRWWREDERLEVKERVLWDDDDRVFAEVGLKGLESGRAESKRRNDTLPPFGVLSKREYPDLKVLRPVLDICAGFVAAFHTLEGASTLISAAPTLKKTMNNEPIDAADLNRPISSRRQDIGTHLSTLGLDIPTIFQDTDLILAHKPYTERALAESIDLLTITIAEETSNPALQRKLKIIRARIWFLLLATHAVTPSDFHSLF